MGNGLLVYMMAIKNARQSNKANRVMGGGKQHTDCLTLCLIDEILETQKRYVDASIELTFRYALAIESGNPLKHSKISV